MNLLANPSFEQGWTDDGPRQIPNGWQFWYATPDLPNDLDPDGHEWAAPEMRHLAREHLPEHEHSLFFWDDSKYTLKVFAPRWHCAWFRLWQVVNLAPGRYKLTVPFFPDIVEGYTGSVKIPAPDPYSGLMRLYYAGDKSWQTMQPFLEKAERFYHFDVLNMDGGPTDVGVEFMMPFPLAGSCAIFTDAWTLEAVTDGEPQPCRGTPRVQYARTYNVLPQNATLEQAVDVLKATYPQRQTIGFSSDDAGIGDLDSRSIVEWMRSAAEQPDYADFYARYYPGIALRFKPLPGTPPGDFEQPGGEFLTLHLQTEVTGWLDYVRAVKPGWVKLVGGAELSRRIKEASPGTQVLYRHHVQDHAPYLNDANPYRAALRFLDLFWPAVEANPIDCVEGLNETIATHDEAGTRKAVAFEAALSDAVAERSGGQVGACILNTAVGNPDHNEVEWLLDAADAACENGHYVGYHAYFPVCPDKARSGRWLDEEFEHFHGRALASWDVVFAEHGLAPRYLFTESGACAAAARSDGRPGGMNPGGGWRSVDGLNGDLNFYIDLLLRFRLMVQEWNVEHDNRAEAAMIFTTGQPWVNWPGFLFNGPELARLAEVLT